MIQKVGKILIYGFLLWLTVFAGSILIFPIKDQDPIFFETLISLILAASTVLFGHLYFKNEILSLKYCLIVGICWTLINIGIDLPMFSYGPMKRTFLEYMTDIGLTYIMIPIILSVFAFRTNVSHKK